MRIGLSGHEYIAELLDSGHSKRIHEVLRMQAATFYTLRDWLLANTAVVEGPKGEKSAKDLLI
jgi:uncharacterized protein (DUF2267 family)